MQKQTHTPERKSTQKTSSQKNKKRFLTLLHSDWDAEYNPVPMVKTPRSWNKDYPDVERLLSFH